jgi:hypothetical protein
MTARLRTIGIGGSIAALLATGALLLPAAPAQAMPSAGTCGNLWASAQLAFANHRWDMGMEFLTRYVDIGCTK